MPRIKSRLARIEPSSEAWTMRISSWIDQRLIERNTTKQCIPLKVQCYTIRESTVSIGLSNHRYGHEGKNKMIWDAIDMIMPLRGLLALSCLDLF